MGIADELKDLGHPDTFTRRQRILAVVSDAISDILYYDRKEDDELGVDGIPEAVKAGEITVEEMAEAFTLELRKGLSQR